MCAGFAVPTPSSGAPEWQKTPGSLEHCRGGSSMFSKTVQKKKEVEIISP